MKDGKTPKWGRPYYVTGTSYLSFPSDSLIVGGVGYSRMRGVFYYGGKLQQSYNSEIVINQYLVAIGLRPDWEIEAQPFFCVNYGLSNIKRKDIGLNSNGSMVGYSFGLEIAKAGRITSSLFHETIFHETNSEIDKGFTQKSILINISVDFDH